MISTTWIIVAMLVIAIVVLLIYMHKIQGHLLNQIDLVAGFNNFCQEIFSIFVVCLKDKMDEHEIKLMLRNSITIKLNRDGTKVDEETLQILVNDLYKEIIDAANN